MSVFKFAGINGRYITAVPYKDRWLMLEECRDGVVTQYHYIPGFPQKVQHYTDNNKCIYIYGSKALYLRHCTFKYVPSWAVAGNTLK